MRIRFLLGPAGSGKTHRCLDEIRTELLRDPSGPPLLLLAPKQSTFQLERALLEDDRLPGWSRLQILSFERLARQVLSETGPVDLLTEEGRLMVLRALVREKQPELRVFRSSARLAGFAQELSAALRELQCHQLSPPRLEDLALRVADTPALAGKLHDLALLLRAYHERLASRQVLDVDRLPDLAAEALRGPDSGFRLEALWLDGFAEMTPQEMDLLAAVAAHARQATLAFCVDREYREDASWLSTWSVVSQTLRRCLTRLAALSGVDLVTELLPAFPASGRFGACPALAHLAEAWAAPRPAPDPVRSGAAGAIRMVACRDTEREAVVAAREIRRHVRNGGRFREVAILLRALESEAPVWQRVLLRYGIPSFFDRREPLAHHPVAELSRGALRLATHDWPVEDWFAVLKTGLTPVPSDRVDAWENLSLRLGWDGPRWRRAPEDPPAELAGTGPLLTELIAPFRQFAGTLGPNPSARILAGALRRLWDDLGVRARLDAWGGAGVDSGPGEYEDPAAPGPTSIAALHRAAWEQLLAWLDSLELGFGDEPVALADWLPVMEAGLSALTAGVIPPAQDQVVVGAIDRTRQPELKLALVAGLNEGVFPALPRPGGLLSEAERDRLADAGALLGPDRRRRVGHERFYGYIACTRASDRLVLTWSQRDGRGRPLNPSPFVGHVRGLFPDLKTDTDEAEEIAADAPVAVLAERAVHRHEILPWLLARPEPTALDGLAGDPSRRAWLRRCRPGPGNATDHQLAPAAVLGLYGVAPEVTVSALESLAACPFQFFAQHGLQGKERERLEADPRQAGTLAHRLLARFHEHATRDGRRWRDLTPDRAREVLADAARELVTTTANGLFEATPEARWQAERLTAGLAECVATLVRWTDSYAFDPVRAELSFGGPAPLPSWSPDPADPEILRLRGTVDRVDVLRRADGTAAFAVMDYKLRPPRFDETRTEAGVDLQLAAYVLALTDLLPRLGLPAVGQASPAGMFFIGLRGRPRAGTTRRDLPARDSARREIHVHRGRFSTRDADAFDRPGPGAPSGQFSLARNKDGSVRRSGDGRSEAEFGELLERVRETILRLAGQLRSGGTAPAPYRHGSRTACEQCRVAAVCRFDPWLQPFRPLGRGSPT